MARFTTKISLRGAIRGRTCARCATARPRNRRWCIALRTRYARARCVLPPETSRPRSRALVPRFTNDGMRRRPPASRFSARASSVVGRRPRRDRRFPRRYPPRALPRRTHAPRLADRHVPPFRRTSACVRAVRRRLRSRPTRYVRRLRVFAMFSGKIKHHANPTSYPHYAHRRTCA